MPETVDRIHDALMEDPDFEAFPDKTKEESAWAVAWKRYKQQQNNERALTLGNPEEEVTKQTFELPAPDFTELPKNERLPDRFQVTNPVAKMEKQEVDTPRNQEQPPYIEAKKSPVCLEKSCPMHKQDEDGWEDEENDEEVEEEKTEEELFDDLDEIIERLADLREKFADHEETEKELELSKGKNAYQKGLAFNKDIKRWTKPRNTETPDQITKQIRNPFAVATAAAKKMGYKDFAEGSPGKEKKGEIAEAIKRTMKSDDNSIIKAFLKQEWAHPTTPMTPPHPGLIFDRTRHRWVRPVGHYRIPKIGYHQLKKMPVTKLGFLHQDAADKVMQAAREYKRQQELQDVGQTTARDYNATRQNFRAALDWRETVKTALTYAKHFRGVK